MTIEENRGRARRRGCCCRPSSCWRTRSARAYIARHFLEFEFIRILPVLDITCMHNVGAAFSFLASASGWQRWVFIGLAVVVSIGITIWLFKLPRGAQPCWRRASRWCWAARSAMSSTASAWGT